MVHRDPQTGQFVAGDDGGQFDDIEVVTFGANVGIEASNLGGGTGFQPGDGDTWEGVQLIDYDNVVDRNEELHLLSAAHTLSVYANSTETADGTVHVAAEASASPSPSQAIDGAAGVATDSVDSAADNVVGRAFSDDSIDTVGRVLFGVGHAPHSDGATGTGGGGSAGEDRYEQDGFPSEYGRFHPRDELFYNGRAIVWNIDDAGIHAALNGQHVYGVIDA